MAVPRIRADYNQLGQAAQRFGAAAESAAATLQSLQKNLQVLEGGDWVGEGAKAFYQEMGQTVLPSLKRLNTDYVDLYQTHSPDRAVNAFARLDYVHEPAKDERDQLT